MNAKVTEDLTGLVQSCETLIEIAPHYEIRTNLRSNVKFEQDASANITVRKLNNFYWLLEIYIYLMGNVKINLPSRYLCEIKMVYFRVLPIQAEET